jgi:PD-(D/E)XK endonuclease
MPRGIALQPTDGDIKRAIKAATSWRGVMRELGYRTTNGRTAARIRQYAEDQSFDTSHFRGCRGWSDDELRAALKQCDSWSAVLRRLGMATGGGNIMVAIKARAKYLQLDYSHIESRRRVPTGEVPFADPPQMRWLRAAAPTLAAGWFAHRGYRVSFPAEPCPYDLVVDVRGILYRVQVKSATGRDATSGQWVCNLAQNPKFRKTVLYDPEDVDFFFIIDGDMNYYITPIEEVAGRGSVTLSTLRHRKVSR